MSTKSQSCGYLVNEEESVRCASYNYRTTNKISRARKVIDLDKELLIAKQNAWESLSRSEFQQFGYWAEICIGLIRLCGGEKANPFCEIVSTARGKFI